ncbi:MAG: hypothetical protein UW87_C0035G0002 [Candidatus Moranbacteria bacterium GW2011_GWC2_45_10]|nr:MAG: hypothetical protein UW87_C0035G0002 [Candidatus Moranbacteria bacterium GW2011_GWC2_45_10]
MPVETPDKKKNRNTTLNECFRVRQSGRGCGCFCSINQSAVKGLQIRKIEKEISQMKKENESLKIKEAELKSLYKIEQFSKDLNMSEAAEVTFLDESNPLALHSAAKEKIR